MAAGGDGSGSAAEQISALMDSELPMDQAKSLLLKLSTGEARWRWDVYHLIGDALRDQSDQAHLALDLVRSVARKLDH
ncbi:MAG: RseA family anti-sigma factor [Burkholderiaceae bacterium]